LLKRRDLATDVSKRLEIIDHECTEQIDRMELLFRGRTGNINDQAHKHSSHSDVLGSGFAAQHSRWQKTG